MPCQDARGYSVGRVNLDRQDYSCAGAGVRKGRVGHSGVCADLQEPHQHTRLCGVCNDSRGCVCIWPDQDERAGQVIYHHCRPSLHGQDEACRPGFAGERVSQASSTQHCLPDSCASRIMGDDPQPVAALCEVREGESNHQIALLSKPYYQAS